MRVECIKEKLAGVISKADKITGKNLTLPVLSCIYLEAKNNYLTIKSTNLDLGVELNIPVKIEEEGIVAVPGNILNSFISNLNDDNNIKIETVDNNLNISTVKNSTVIKTFNHEDFPTIPVVSKEKFFKVNSVDFIKGLKSVWYSSGVSSMKPELSSVYIYQDNGNVVFAATDSFRLAEKKIKMKKPKEFGSIMIPFKNISEIIRTFDEIKDDIEVCMEKNQISFSYDNIYLTSRIIDGVFPDYKQIIPKESTTKAVVLKQDLINSLKIANIFSNKFNEVNIKVVPNHKKIEIKTKNSDVGENTNFIDAVITGDSLDISFNFKYIVDCFQSIDSDSVELNFNGLNRPVVVRGMGDLSFMYLVMPMNK